MSEQVWITFELAKDKFNLEPCDFNRSSDKNWVDWNNFMVRIQ